MEYFLNYGGVLILSALVYIIGFWVIPIVFLGCKKWSEYIFFVLLIHCLVGLTIWAGHGLALSSKI